MQLREKVVLLAMRKMGVVVRETASLQKCGEGGAGAVCTSEKTGKRQVWKGSEEIFAGYSNDGWRRGGVRSSSRRANWGV